MATLRNSRVLWIIPVLIVLFALSPVIAQAQDGIPVADAGSSRYADMDPVLLDGTGSFDPDNSGTLSYTWQQIFGPAVSITDANTATPTISGFIQTDEIQECEFELIVGDGELTSTPDTVKVFVVRDYGTVTKRLYQLNPPFDPDKPTLVGFAGVGGCQNIGPWVHWSTVAWKKVNFLTYERFYASTVNLEKLGDMFIVYLSSQAPDYKQPIQTFGHSAGGEPAIKIAIYLNETYTDRRYAVNRVTLLDAAQFCQEYQDSIDKFLASAVDGEQCWVDNYISTLPGSHSMYIYRNFQSNVLNVGFEKAADDSLSWQEKHNLAGDWYGNSVRYSDMNQFNHGVVGGAYWSVVGPGKNLQLASTPDTQTYKFKWYGDAYSGYMDFYDEPNHPGKLPEPITLGGPIGIGDPNSFILTCKESENAIGYQLLFGPDPYRVMDYIIISDTPHPPDQVLTDLPFEETWWTVRARDQYGSTIYADPIRINLEDLSLLTIDNLTNGRRYSSIQLAIDDADSGDEITIGEGIYQENISINGKTLTVTSINPNDPTVVAATIINGADQLPVITLFRSQDPGCVLAGLTITGGTVGISCGDASATIRNCTIESIPISIEYFYDYEPTIIDCTILGSIMEVYEPSHIALWKMDETEGTIAHDSIGINDGICNGEPAWQPDGGKLNGALQLDGMDDYVRTPFVSNPADGSFSVFAWIKGGAPGQIVISQTDGANWLLADSSGGNLMTELKGTVRGAAALLSQTAIVDGNWHRLGFVWDGSDRTLYVDDVEVARDTQTDLGSSEGSLHFGAGSNRTQASFFSGLMDDIRIYNRAVCP